MCTVEVSKSFIFIFRWSGCSQYHIFSRMVLVLPSDPGYYHYVQHDPSLRQAFVTAAMDPKPTKKRQLSDSVEKDMSPDKSDYDIIEVRFSYGGKVPRHLLASKGPRDKHIEFGMKGPPPPGVLQNVPPEIYGTSTDSNSESGSESESDSVPNQEGFEWIYGVHSPTHGMLSKDIADFVGMR